ncbi:MAG: thiamine phosphate synthase [Polyangiaceae bacterium]|nr:thiamine phosphate synthase [Polyangiaceae bacterium]
MGGGAGSAARASATDSATPVANINVRAERCTPEGYQTPAGRGRAHPARGCYRAGSPLIARGLYALVCLDAVARAALDAEEAAEAVLRGGARTIQLRGKSAGSGELVSLGRRLAARCRRYGAAFVVNDRADVAALVGADAVHVGRGDLRPSEVRAVAPGLRVGVSTHDLGELEAALAERPDYVAFGPVFPTASKRDPDPVVGLEALARARDLAARAGVALVAIGGVDLARAPEVAARATAGAVIGALYAERAPACVERRARALHAALGGATAP